MTLATSIQDPFSHSQNSNPTLNQGPKWLKNSQTKTLNLKLKETSK